MKRWNKHALGLGLTLGLAGCASAQIPAAPAVAAPAVPVPAAAADAAALGAPGVPVVAAPKPGGMIGNLITTCDYCKAKLCASPLGQMLNNMMAPLGAFTGGIIRPLCPPNAVIAADLAKPPDSALGAAARIKADEAEAAARRAAVRYLGTVDCRYWPEAQDALAAALRADRNECVRWEAALALGNGCCCTPVTITALSLTVSGGGGDGNPPEVSDRVRGAAEVALERCLAHFPPPPLQLVPVEPGPPVEKKEGLPPPREVPGGAAQTSAAQPAPPAELAQAVARARAALAKSKGSGKGEATPNGYGRPEGLVGLAMAAMYPPGTPVPALPPSAPAPFPALPQTPPAVSPALHEVPLAPVPAVAPTPAPTPAPAVRPQTYQVPAPRNGDRQQDNPPQAVRPPVREAPALPPPAPPVQHKASTAAPVPSLAMASTTVVSPYTPHYSSPSPPPRPAPAPATVLQVAATVPAPTPAPAPAHPAPLGLTREGVADYLTVLANGTEAKDRAWAAAQLGGADWRSDPAIADGLLSAAVGDVSPDVRLACLGTLIRLRVDSRAALGWYQSLTAVDRDPRVRRAALDALTRLRTEAKP